MEYRGYFFTNMYLSSIQNGIQSAHCIHDMFTKYAYTSCQRVLILNEWAENHKTMIVLNGGYSKNLVEMAIKFDTNANQYPWVQFRESDEALDGATTALGIILPEYIYNLAAEYREKEEYVVELANRVGESTISVNEITIELNEFDKWLIRELNNYKLAS